MGRLRFQVEAEASGSRARAGRLRTLHNEIETPIFMPVGTRATVRAQGFDFLWESGSRILLANTFHLFLRPGPEVFRKVGGIHRFMNWKGSVLTDSGGFQVFSLKDTQVSEKGVSFRAYDGERRVFLTPEDSIETQKAIGSDIMMAFDQCVPSTSERPLVEEAMHRTYRWARRSLEARGDSPQSLFGIVQGACIPELRRVSAEQITALPFDGFAIGGLAVGETKGMREDFTEMTAELLPRDLPRYLMGVGTPIDLLEAVHRGVDMFDCILPGALAQQGEAYTWKGRLSFRRGVYKFSEEPLDRDCACQTCRTYSRAYLHHLIKSREVLGWQLIGSHNIHFYHELMRAMRRAIVEDRFAEFHARHRERLAATDEENPITRPPRARRRGGPALELGAYEVHQSEAGFSSIRHRASGEIMHSVSDPSEEARRIYVEQSALAERLQAGADEFVIWDVGLGAATNAMAAVRCAEELAARGLPARKLFIASFENDLDSLRLAARHPARFKYLRHGAPGALLEKGEWHCKTAPLSWKLWEGDFLEKLREAPAPDLIFYDPFSFRTDSPLWTLQAFERVFEACRGRAVELYTYSASTAVRSALLGAGFLVARGVPTGPKSETTIALTPEVKGDFALLDRDWLARWERSTAKFPPGLTPEQQERVAERIQKGIR